MTNQPTELQRARWWRRGWWRKYIGACDADMMTEQIDQREIDACARYGKSVAEKLAAETRESGGR